MYGASCYSSENENKLVEICFIKNYIFFIFLIMGGGGGLNREGDSINKDISSPKKGKLLKRGGFSERGGGGKWREICNNGESIRS